MGLKTYKVKVPELVSQLQKRGLLTIRGKEEKPALYLVRQCGLAPNTAYQAMDSEKADRTSMDSLWLIYTGLRQAGITVLEKGKERPLRFEGDVYEEVEAD